MDLSSSSSAKPPFGGKNFVQCVPSAIASLSFIIADPLLVALSIFCRAASHHWW
jgi:hypothetical protein